MGSRLRNPQLSKKLLSISHLFSLPAPQHEVLDRSRVTRRTNSRMSASGLPARAGHLWQRLDMRRYLNAAESHLDSIVQHLDALNVIQLTLWRDRLHSV